MTAGNVTNVLPCDPLNAVGARFVEGLATVDVGVEEGFGKFCELHV